MRVIIFGADKLGVGFYFDILHQEDVIAFIDNNSEKWGKEIMGIEIFPPDQIKTLVFDKIYIASLRCCDDIRRQILSMNVAQNKISYIPPVLDNVRTKAKKLIEDLYQYQNVSRQGEYEEQWRRIRKEYKDIRIHGIYANAIGEMIPRFFLAEEMCREKGVLRVFIPETDTGSLARICNKYLLKLLRRKIYLLDEDELSLWAYIIYTHTDEVDISAYDVLRIRNDYLTYQLPKENADIWFTGEEVRRGEHFLEQIHLESPFVCVAARNSSYNKKTIGHDFFYDYRNMEFRDFGVAIACLQQNKITSVRMGRMEDPIDLENGCIDYAGLYADDFRDLLLASRCEFMISTSSGIVFMATLFSRPVLVVNSLFISFGYGGSPYTADDLYIPKKYYDMNKGRYLTLKETIVAEMQCLIWGDRYWKMGIKFINNTPEEIASATEEMLERLAGRWQDTEEDERNYLKYMELYEEMKRSAANNPQNWIGGPIPYRIAATYLRNNLYLLD